MIKPKVVQPTKEQFKEKKIEDNYFKNYTLVFNPLFLMYELKTIKELLSKYSPKQTLCIENGVLILTHNNYTINMELFSKVSSHKEPLIINKKISNILYLFNKADKYFFSNLEKVDNKLLFYINDIVNIEVPTDPAIEVRFDDLNKHQDKPITIPSSAKEKMNIYISNSVVMKLQVYKKKEKESPYIIYIDKESYEIMAIGIQGNNEYIEYLNDDIINIDVSNREYIFVTVEELFPIKTKEEVAISIYQTQSNLYVESTLLVNMNAYVLVCINKTNVQNYEHNLEMKTSNELKREWIEKDWHSSTALNKFKFTIHAPCKDFHENLFAFLEEVNILQTKSNLKIKLHKFKLDGEGEEDFFYLKITNTSHYTFTFFDMFNTASVNSTQEYKLHVIQKILSYIKSQDLYKHTKIKSIGFNTIFQKKKLFPQIRLIKLNTGRDADLYTLFHHQKSKNIYTTSTYYKAYLKQYKEIIELWQKRNKKDVLSSLSISKLSDKQKKYILENSISKKIKDATHIEVVQETNTLFYARVISTKPISKPVNLDKCIELDFFVHVDNKSNYFKISHTRKSIDVNEKKEFYEEVSYAFEVNKWETKNKNIVEKDSTVYYITLADNLDMIVDTVFGFSEKYKLIASSNIMLLSNLDTLEFSTRKQLEDKIHLDSSTVDFIKLESNYIKKTLHDIILG